MPTTSEAWQAGVDAVIADNGLNRGGFADAVRTVLTQKFTNSEATGWIDAVAVKYNELGLINNPTYNNLRSSIISAGAVGAMALFDALAVAVGSLPETEVAETSARLVSLREDRDEINNALDRCNALIAAEPSGVVGRMVKDILRQGKDQLRVYREDLRSQIESITGDPDA